MKVNVIAFSDKGYVLAEKIAKEYEGTYTFGGRMVKTSEWVAEHWGDSDALIFVGAMGIAVRNIAGHIEHKAKDPAVVVIDDMGKHVIPVLSGHLGGANKLALQLAGQFGAEPVITTATDIAGKFAVDEWAKAQNMKVQTPSRIKNVSSKVLAGQEIKVKCFEEIAGKAPENVKQANGDDVDVMVEIIKKNSPALILVPRICVLGIGCRRGTSKVHIEDAFKRFLSASGIEKCSITSAASIDVKKDEAGLIAFAQGHGWDMNFYTADELNAVEGKFSSSKFVAQTVGVDNVCERSAVKSAGPDGKLVIKKFAYEGVTFALARKGFRPDWVY